MNNRTDIAESEYHSQYQGKPKGRKILSAFFRIAGILAIVSVVLAILPLFIPRLFGCEVFHVVSGSMEPGIPVGSMVVVQMHINPVEVEEGDIIAFYLGSGVITHRVVSNHQEEQNFLTKGDANVEHDMAPVPYSALIGTIVLTVPAMGEVQALLTGIVGKAGLFLLLLGGVLLLMAASRMKKQQP